jgi:electron transfer flavoprotein alpha subunit
VSVNAWIVVGDQPAIGNLITVARSLGGPVGAVVAGPRSVAETVAASGVDKVVWCGTPDDVPAEASAPAVAEAVAADPPRVVLAGRNPGERVLLGAAAARLKAAVLTGARSVAADGDDTIVVNAVFGDISEETVAVSGPVALLLDGGSVPPPDGTTAPIEEVSAPPLGLKVIETRMFDFDEVDLNAAHRVIGVGRGLKAKEDLALIGELATAIGAEVACSRPVAEGLNWMGKDRYIGSSGAHIAPQLYLAVGISGQLQHMVGVLGAETIVAINSDPNAAVFTQTDYGLVGDLYQLVPAIAAALK